MLKQIQFLLTLLIIIFALGYYFVHATDNDSSGFISIDCGLPKDSNYTDISTTLNYVSDENFISTGTIHRVAKEYNLGWGAEYFNTFNTLRSFKEGTRNCYKINVTANTMYLIRASFFHGNYDGQNTPVKFDIHLGGNYWETVFFADVWQSSVKEIIHIPWQNYVRVCVVNTGLGTPFVSALELRPIPERTYYSGSIKPLESLSLVWRMDLGSDFALRYPYDAVDRQWFPGNLRQCTQINTTQPISTSNGSTLWAPSIVMSTAITPLNEDEPLSFSWVAPNTATNYYFFLYFAELKELMANESRAFTVTLSGKYYFTVVPRYLHQNVLSDRFSMSGSMEYTISLNKIENNSTLPPILNAVELYSVLDLSQPETLENDVDGINNIKSTYGVNKSNWDGDPCVPKSYMWTGLNCSNSTLDPPRIISLNLSSSGLIGEISRHFGQILALETLDLSNNNLTGKVPDFLSKLPNLRILNLERNNLSGPLPSGLIEKTNKGLLSLSFDQSMNLCESSECNLTERAKQTKKNILIPIISSVGGFVLLIIAIAIIVRLKKMKPDSKPTPTNGYESTKRKYTYGEVKKMTKNFERVLGRGGFGEVFYGLIDENDRVAVKVLSSSSRQGCKQFEAEVNLLMKVHHANLTNLVGYCYEESNMALIYEYMENRDLASHLSTGTMYLSWERRLHIAIDAAQGLEYLHNGCKPPIIHRDIKTANILLDENLQAKIGDFGLSKIFGAELGSHVSTSVYGTRGYLDPKYEETGWLNAKSDVYSFGVVLLEIITGRSPLLTKRNKPNEKIHVTHWVRSCVSKGDITNVVDMRLRGDFDTNSVWKFVEVGLACASESPTRRPNMSEVVNELKECLTLEIARKQRGPVGFTDSSSASETATNFESFPLAR